jgi:predicted nuclease with TOPRIM domain
MSDNGTPNIVPEHLRAIRADLGEIKSEITELRHRVGLMEIGYATMQNRFDRMAGDIEQIKRRLDLVDA